MNKTKMIKTVKKKSIYDSTSKDHSTPSYLKGSAQSSGRVRIRTILGEKFDYGEKIKEKDNYVLYKAGQGQEKKEIEEIEELPMNGGKKERIVEQKQIIDNYQYHETKEIKNKHARNSQTQHKRLCDPFERTMFKKYSSSTSEPRKGGYKIIRTTNIVDKNDYSIDYFHNNKNNIKAKLSSLTTRSQSGHNSKRIDRFSNISISSSTNDSNKSLNRTNMTQISDGTRRSTSKGGKITDYSQYKRRKVNGIEKIDNYSINSDKREKIVIPKNNMKYNYNKNKNTISRSLNNSYNRIPNNTSKYSNSSSSSNIQKNTSLNRIEYNNGIKLDFNIKKEKSLIEGPKYKLVGKDLPKDKPEPETTLTSRSRSNRVRKQVSKQSRKNISMENKGYIPFSGKGVRVGGAPTYIPRPHNRNKIPKPYEERYSSIKIERQSNITETSQRSNGNISNISNNYNNNYSTLSRSSNSQSNIRGMKEFQRKKVNNNQNIRRNINTKNYKRKSKSKNVIRITNDIEENKFPGKGIRVGSSGINRSEMISELNNTISYAEYKKFEKDNMDILKISGKKKENIRCFEQSLFYQGEQNGMHNDSDKKFEENLCSREEKEENEEIFKEIFCPIHGKQIIRICDFVN